MAVVWRVVGRLLTKETPNPPPEAKADSFGILVLGDAGTGKSTLINRLLEEDVAAVEHSPQREGTPEVACHSGKIHDVPVNLYDSPSLSSSSAGHSDLKQELESREVHAFVCCIRVSENRMRGSVIDALQGYHSAGVDWSRTTIALTFADCISVPKEVKHEPAGVRQHFEKILAQWQGRLRKVLVEKLGVKGDVAEKMQIYPATGDSDKLLMNGEQWLFPLQFAIILLLPPGAMKMYQDSLAGCSKALKQRYQSSSSTSESSDDLATSVREDSYTSIASLSTSSSERFEGADISPMHSLTSLSGRHEDIHTSATLLPTSISEEHECMTTSTAPSDDQTQFWRSVRDILSRLRAECPIFGILVIGETGTGKSTLINNLLGRQVAPVSHAMDPGTLIVTPHELSVEGVPVVVYDTPGLNDRKGNEYEKKHLGIMNSLLARKKIHLIIYCMKMTETRMRGGLIHTFKEYHKIGVPWEQTVVALTFADKERAIDSRLPEMCTCLSKVLVEEVGLTESMANRIKIHPTTAHHKELLPNGSPWYVPFWLNVQEILLPAAMTRFLDMHKGNIRDDEVLACGIHSQMQISLTGGDRVQFAKSFAATLHISKSQQEKLIETVSGTGSDAIRIMLSEDDSNEELKSSTHKRT